MFKLVTSLSAFSLSLSRVSAGHPVKFLMSRFLLFLLSRFQKFSLLVKLHRLLQLGCYNFHSRWLQLPLLQPDLKHSLLYSVPFPSFPSSFTRDFHTHMPLATCRCHNYKKFESDVRPAAPRDLAPLGLVYKPSLQNVGYVCTRRLPDSTESHTIYISSHACYISSYILRVNAPISSLKLQLGLGLTHAVFPANHFTLTLLLICFSSCMTSIDHYICIGCQAGCRLRQLGMPHTSRGPSAAPTGSPGPACC